MKKIYTSIFIIFAVLVLGFYIIQISIAKEKVQVKLEDLTGNKAVMGNDKLKTTIYDGVLDAYEGIISKDKIEIKDKDIDLATIGVSQDQFKDKELFRHVRHNSLPLYEDNQYRVVIGTKAEYDSINYSHTERINISYRNKSNDKLKNFIVNTSKKYSSINMFNMYKNNGELQLVFKGNEENNNESTIEFCTIDLEKETLKSNKIVSFKDILGVDENIEASVYSEGKIFIATSKYYEEKEGEFKVLVFDIKDYSLKEYKNNIIDTKKDLQNIVNNNNGTYVGDNKIILYSIYDDEMYIDEFDTKTCKFKRYDNIKLDHNVYEIKLEKSEKEYIYHNIMGMKENHMYIITTKNNMNRNNAQEEYITIIDLNKVKTEYVGRIYIPRNSTGLKLE